MKIDKEKLHEIAVEENEIEKLFSEDMIENKEFYKTSMHLALKIRRAMRLKGISENALAHDLWTDTLKIKEMLSGKFNFDLKTIVKIENLLDIPIINSTICC